MLKKLSSLFCVPLSKKAKEASCLDESESVEKFRIRRTASDELSFSFGSPAGSVEDLADSSIVHALYGANGDEGEGECSSSKTEERKMAMPGYTARTCSLIKLASLETLSTKLYGVNCQLNDSLVYVGKVLHEIADRRQKRIETPVTLKEDEIERFFELKRNIHDLLSQMETLIADMDPDFVERHDNLFSQIRCFMRVVHSSESNFTLLLNCMVAALRF